MVATLLFPISLSSQPDLIQRPHLRLWVLISIRASFHPSALLLSPRYQHLCRWEHYYFVSNVSNKLFGLRAPRLWCSPCCTSPELNTCIFDPLPTRVLHPLSFCVWGFVCVCVCVCVQALPISFDSVCVCVSHTVKPYPVLWSVKNTWARSSCSTIRFIPFLNQAKKRRMRDRERDIWQWRTCLRGWMTHKPVLCDVCI